MFILILLDREEKPQTPPCLIQSDSREPVGWGSHGVENVKAEAGNLVRESCLSSSLPIIQAVRPLWGMESSRIQRSYKILKWIFLFLIKTMFRLSILEPGWRLTKAHQSPFLFWARVHCLPGRLLESPGSIHKENTVWAEAFSACCLFLFINNSRYCRFVTFFFILFFLAETDSHIKAENSR